MSDLRQAARQALDLLKQLQGGCTDSDDGTVEALTVWCPEVIANLEAALEQDDTHLPRREWRGLTNEEISDIFEAETRYHYPPICATDREFARAIEAALKERNA